MCINRNEMMDESEEKHEVKCYIYISYSRLFEGLKYLKCCGGMRIIGLTKASYPKTNLWNPPEALFTYPRILFPLIRWLEALLIKVPNLKPKVSMYN